MRYDGTDSTTDWGAPIGADVGPVLYAQQRVSVLRKEKSFLVDQEPQLFEVINSDKTPDGHVGEQYPVEIVAVEHF